MINSQTFFFGLKPITVGVFNIPDQSWLSGVEAKVGASQNPSISGFLPVVGQVAKVMNPEGLNVVNYSE